MYYIGKFSSGTNDYMSLFGDLYVYYDLNNKLNFIQSTVSVRREQNVINLPDDLSNKCFAFRHWLRTIGSPLGLNFMLITNKMRAVSLGSYVNDSVDVYVSCIESLDLDSDVQDGKYMLCIRGSYSKENFTIVDTGLNLLWNSDKLASSFSRDCDKDFTYYIYISDAIAYLLVKNEYFRSEVLKRIFVQFDCSKIYSLI